MRPYTGEHFKVLDPSASWLTGRAADLYSQFGEDGLIAACLERFGSRNKCCFEVGAADGVFFSNTKILRDDGWRAVLIEKDDEPFSKLRSFATDNVFPVQADVTERSLDVILAAHGMPLDLDLGVIDIDGQDYHVWDDMKVFAPRLVLIEFGESTALDLNAIPPRGDRTGKQAGRDALIKLGASKGYTALAQTYVNLLFCKMGAE